MKIALKLLTFTILIFLLPCCEKKTASRDISSSVSLSVAEEKIKDDKNHLTENNIQKKTDKKNRKPLLSSREMLYRQLQQTSRQFTINPLKDTIVSGTQGTLLEIKANSFLLEGKDYKGPVSLSLKECYTAEDMIFANLSTVSNDRLLESGGMVHLEASAKGRALQLSKNITLKMPAEERKEYMQLFYASEDLKGTMNWQQASSLNPQFAIGNNLKKPGSKNLLPANYLVGTNGMTSVATTVSIVKDGKEQELSVTSYANRELFQEGLDNISLRFEIDDQGIIQNTLAGDSTVNKRYKVKVHKLESMSSTSMTFYPYTPGNLRFMDCALLFTTSITGKGAEPCFILPRHDYTAIKKKTGKNKKTLVIVRNSYIFISNNAEQNRYHEIKKQLDSSGNDLKDIASDELAYYVFNINQLGWINCDRFYNVPASRKIDFTVANTEGADLKMVFSNIRSVMKGSEQDQKTIFKNIPENQEVTLIGIRIKKEKAELAILKTTTKRNAEDKLIYVPVTVEELKNKIKMVL